MRNKWFLIKWPQLDAMLLNEGTYIFQLIAMEWLGAENLTTNRLER